MTVPCDLMRSWWREPNSVNVQPWVQSLSKRSTRRSCWTSAFTSRVETSELMNSVSLWNHMFVSCVKSHVDLPCEILGTGGATSGGEPTRRTGNPSTTCVGIYRELIESHKLSPKPVSCMVKVEHVRRRTIHVWFEWTNMEKYNLVCIWPKPFRS